MVSARAIPKVWTAVWATLVGLLVFGCEASTPTDSSGSSTEALVTCPACTIRNCDSCGPPDCPKVVISCSCDPVNDGTSCTSGGTCKAGVCKPPPPTSCTGWNQLSSDGSQCVACGVPSTPPCTEPSSTQKGCESGTLLVGGLCIACGGNLQIACAGGVCNPGTSNMNGTCSVPCGASGQPTCPGGTCNAGTVATDGTCCTVGTSSFEGTCLPCGAVSEFACGATCAQGTCSGGTCNPGLIVNSGPAAGANGYAKGACMPCGGPSQPACTNNACTAPNVDVGGTCECGYVKIDPQSGQVIQEPACAGGVCHYSTVDLNGICVCGGNGQPSCVNNGVGYACEAPFVLDPASNTCFAPTVRQTVAVVLCQYADVPGVPPQDGKPTSPADKPYFVREFTPGWGGSADYFFQQSYGAVTFVPTVFDWHTTSAKFSVVGGNTRPNNGALTCLTEQQAKTDLSGYDGIVVVMNKNTDSGATNVGPTAITLSGKTYNIPFVVTSPGGFAISFLAHEMGHSMFGLQHSYDAGTTVYGDWFDLMSCLTCAYSSDPSWAVTGPNLGAGTRASKGWIPSSRIVTYSGKTTTANLAALDHPWVDGALMVKIPLSDGSYYTLESRKSTDGGIDKGMAQSFEQDPVLLQRLDTAGKLHLILAGTGPRGGMQTGDSYTDATNKITVKVTAKDTVNNRATVTVSPSN